MQNKQVLSRLRELSGQLGRVGIGRELDPPLRCRNRRIVTLLCDICLLLAMAAPGVHLRWFSGALGSEESDYMEPGSYLVASTLLGGFSGLLQTKVTGC